MRIININNNNIYPRITFKSYIELLLNILIIVPSIIYFLYLKQKNSKINSNNIKYKSDTQSPNNTQSFFRSLAITLQGSYTKEEIIEKIQYKDIVDKLSKKKYYGKWFTPSSENRTLIIGEATSGLTLIKFSKALQEYTKEEALALLVNNYENNYINHWLHHSSYIISKSLKLIPDKINNDFILEGKWETELEYGEIFDTKISRRYPCSSNYTFIFKMKKASYFINVKDGENYTVFFDTIDERNFKANLSSYCGFNMSMEMYSEEENSEYYDKKKERKKVFKYFILITVICLLSVLSNVIMINGLNNDNRDVAQCLPLFCLGFNINWHIYCSLTHIVWSFTYKDFYYEFNTIGLLYIINIIFYDFRLSCLFWSKIEYQESNRIYIQKRMIYYTSFYLFFFTSFFILSDLFLYYPTIIIIALLTWTPQIIYNSIYNNKYIYPFIYIISSSLDKLIFGFYFRGYDSNFFRIKGNKTFISILICFILSNFIILYLQYKKGARFFLGKKCQKNEYKTKKELIDTIKDVDKMECVICLMPIFFEENKEINNLNSTEIDNNQNNIVNNSINSSRNEIKINNELPLEDINDNNNKNKNKNILKKTKKKKFNKINCKFSINCFEFLYKFKKISTSVNKKYMSTPCNHVFHKECLEKWLLLKKECPSCRHDLSDIII